MDSYSIGAYFYQLKPIWQESFCRLQYCEVMGRTLLFHRKDGEVLDYVQNISSKTITMTDGIQIPIPHGKYSELKDKFFDYFFRKNQTFLS